MRTALVLLTLGPLGCATSWRSAGIDLSLAAAPGHERSVFPKGAGELDEDAIDEMMAPPRLPRGNFRVAIAAVPTFAPGTPDSVNSGIDAAHAFARELESAGRVELATEVTPYLPARGAGVEGLREIAARYRAPYLLVYVERFEETGGVNAFGIAYLTILGGLVLPSYTVHLDGVAEASLLDVRTGTILFTVREPVKVESLALPLAVPTRMREMVDRESAEAARRLAKRVAGQWTHFARLDGASGDTPGPEADERG